jgi:hypothetical protein
MEKPIDTIEIDSKTRYALYPDTETWDYLREYDWEGLGVFTISNDRNNESTITSIRGSFRCC